MAIVGNVVLVGTVVAVCVAALDGAPTVGTPTETEQRRTGLCNTKFEHHKIMTTRTPTIAFATYVSVGLPQGLLKFYIGSNGDLIAFIVLVLKKVNDKLGQQIETLTIRDVVTGSLNSSYRICLNAVREILVVTEKRRKSPPKEHLVTISMDAK